jgi:hypothetical protein
MKKAWEMGGVRAQLALYEKLIGDLRGERESFCYTTLKGFQN